MRRSRPPGPGPPPGRGPGRPSQQPPRPGLWRWRRNPLRRREDIIEAWIILVVWIVVAVGGVLAGALAARATEDTLARQRAERHHVTAALTEDASWSATTAGQDGQRVQATVRWTGPDGATHTGRTFVTPGQQAGHRVHVWTDQRGRLTSAPPGQAEATLQSVLLGGSAALAFSGLTYVSGRAVRLGLDHHRATRWDKEWAAVEPRWGHRMG